MKAQLILIPTPIKEELFLAPQALNYLTQAASDPLWIILVEELKVARRRWLQWGLPREAIERFVAYNEHTRTQLLDEILTKMKAGRSAVLMSDGGMPAFCDPGRELVEKCHQNGLNVTAAASDNSCVLALAMSGFANEKFVFQGFLPTKGPERTKALQEVWSCSYTQVLMDTPYRRQRLLDELKSSCPVAQKNRLLMLCLELNGPAERLIRGPIQAISQLSEGIEKCEFVLVMNAL